MMVFFIIIGMLVLFFILNHTFLLHTKPALDILDQNYAATEDCWFTKENNKKLIIFLHGMYSTPKTFEDIAQRLIEEGWDIYVPALPASANNKEQLQKIGSWAWEQSVHVASSKVSTCIKNAQKYSHIVLGGHSQGGSLALTVASLFPKLEALIIVASPVNLYRSPSSWRHNIGIYFSGLLCFIKPKGIHIPPKNIEERSLVEKFCDAEGLFFPWTIFTFKHGLRKTRRLLKKITIPVFLAYEKNDQLVNFINQDVIKQEISSPYIEEVVFNISQEREPYGLRHQLLNYSMTKEQLNHKISSFLSDLFQ
ncbi:MAG: alpha/beta hydrolase [Brevinemataceae bacterium]